MITWMAKKVFEIQADSLTNKFCSDPRLTNLFDKYVEDTKKFKKELKDLGLSSREDLKNAINKNPRLKPFVEC